MRIRESIRNFLILLEWFIFISSKCFRDVYFQTGTTIQVPNPTFFERINFGFIFFMSFPIELGIPIAMLISYLLKIFLIFSLIFPLELVVL